MAISIQKNMQKACVLITYAGITLLDPKSKITYEDEEYRLFPLSNRSNKFTLEDSLLCSQDEAEWRFRMIKWR